MKISISLTISADRAPKPGAATAQPDPPRRPEVDAKASASTERAPAWDFDRRPPVGFSATAEPRESR